MKFIAFLIVSAVLFCGCAQTNNKPAPKSQPQVQQQKAPEEQIISSFKTTIYDKSSGRLHNISLAVKALNGLEIKSGQAFSFNETVGERTKARGYKKANVMVGEDYIKDYGGGVCQVSTTLFNAVKNAGLYVVERHTHNKPVAYAEAGTDAAVNYPDLDFKFKNNTDSTIVLNISQNNNVVAVNIVQIL